MVWLSILEWWRKINARRRLLNLLAPAMIVAALSLSLAPGCARVPDGPTPINPKPSPVAPDDRMKPTPSVSAQQFGEDLARAIEAGTWEMTDKFFKDAVKAARLCGLDPQLIDAAFGDVGKNRPLDKAEFAAKARTIR